MILLEYWLINDIGCIKRRQGVPRLRLRNQHLFINGNG